MDEQQHGRTTRISLKLVLGLCVMVSVALLALASYDLGVGIAGHARPFGYSFVEVVLVAAVATSLQILAMVAWPRGDASD